MGVSALITIVVIVILLLMSACFSLSETALTATSKARILRQDSFGVPGTKILLQLIELRDQVVAAILVGNNLVNVLGSSLLTGILVVSFGESGVLYATLLMTPAIVIFGEILPKGYALRQPDASALRFAQFIETTRRVFYRPAQLFVWIAGSTLRLFGSRSENSRFIVSPREEIRSAVDMFHLEGGVVKDDRDMLGGLLDLRDLVVSDVMVHRTKMAVLDAELPPSRLIKEILDSPHTRLPIWRSQTENIVGVLHVKDVLRDLQRVNGDPTKIDIQKVATSPWFVPESTPLAQQLHSFKRRKAHFALAVDEYGVVMGLLTLEDIIEEIVGEIDDEHDVSIASVCRERGGSLVVEGGTPIRDLNRLMDWRLPDEQATTIAGLVIHEAKNIPSMGQAFTFHGMRFEILARQRTRLTSIRITPLKPSADTTIVK